MASQSEYFTAEFWDEAADRAIKTAAQGVVGVNGGLGELMNFFDVNWQNVGGVALGAAVFSLLTSIASARFGKKGSPTLIDTTPPE